MVDKVYNGFGYLRPTFTGLSWDDELWVQAMVVDRVQSDEHHPRLLRNELSVNERELYWLLQSAIHDVADDDRHTGGKGSFTQWVHGEFFVSSETIHLVVTQQVHGGFF